MEYIENQNQQYNCNYIESNSLDFVFSFGVFCHLSLEANDKYLQDIIRVLKPNAKALLFYADEIGLQKFYNDPNIKSVDIFGQFNNYIETMNMMNKYPIVAKRVLDFKDSMILMEKLWFFHKFPYKMCKIETLINKTMTTTKKRTLPDALKKWQAHLSEFRKSHPTMSMKDAMKEAKKTYKK